MKSVFKSVAPMALAITFAMSGVAMAETPAAVSKSADTTTAQPAKPIEHHHKLTDMKKEAVAPTTPTPTTAGPVTTASGIEKTVPVTDTKKSAEAIKAESSKVEPSKTEPAKAK